MDNNKYYISTAIAYTSSKPHIGNTYEIVLADAIARYDQMIMMFIFKLGLMSMVKRLRIKLKKQELIHKNMLMEWQVKLRLYGI